LTYVSAANERGRASTLAVRVDDVLWHEVTSLYDASADEPAYAVKVEDDGSTWVTFGDGKHGRRLPTGTNNVRANYRAGLGSAGDVLDESIIQLKTRPLGLRSVTNPSPATGSADPESGALIRANAPRTVRTLGRIVSLRDYQDFAETFPGIGKARADVVWSPQGRGVFLSVSPVTDGVFDPAAEALTNLRLAIESNRDVRSPLFLGQSRRRYFELAAKIQHHPDYLADLVRADAEGLLLDSFGYSARAIAQPVSVAEVIAALHRVPGVVGVDLDALALSGMANDGASPTTLATILPALPAQSSSGAGAQDASAAELLTILPSGIALSLEVAHV
jgi:predicted phage baseplate assembly protein